MIVAFPLIYLLLSNLQSQSVGSVLLSIRNKGTGYYLRTILTPITFSTFGFGLAAFAGADVGANIGYVRRGDTRRRQAK